MRSAVVVLGGGGRVGRLLERGFRVLGRRSEVCVQSRRPGPGVDWVCGAEREDELTDGLAARAPDLVVCLWGRTQGPDQEVNTDLGLACLSAAAEARVPHVALMSTAAVYAGAPGAALTEDTLARPGNAYGEAKLAMERALAVASADLPDLQISVLRLANVLGADMLGMAAATATDGQPLLLDRLPDGRAPRRSYVSPLTLARLCLAMAEHPRAGGFCDVLNVADGGTHGMDELLQARAEAGSPVFWMWRAAPPSALPELGMSTSRLRALYPSLVGHLRRTAPELVADWLRLDRP